MSDTELAVELTVTAGAPAGPRALFVAVPGHAGPSIVGASVGGCTCLTVG